MSEEQKVEVEDVKHDTADTASEEKQPVNQVPNARFREMVDEKNTLKVELDALKKNASEDAENRKLKEMESKGEYDKIMTEMNTKYEVAKKKADAFDEYQVTKRESLLEKLEEEDRAIYSELSLNKLEAHVEKVTTKPSPASVDNSKPTSTGGYASFEEWASVDPEGYKRANTPQNSGDIKIGYGG